MQNMIFVMKLSLNEACMRYARSSFMVRFLSIFDNCLLHENVLVVLSEMLSQEIFVDQKK